MSKKSKQRKAARLRAKEERKQAGGGLHGLAVSAMSRMRFSLTFRIAMHYCGQLLRTTLRNCVVMTLLLGALCSYSVYRQVDRIRYTMPDQGAEYSQLMLQNKYVSAHLSTSVVPFDLMSLITFQGRAILSNISSMEFKFYVRYAGKQPGVSLVPGNESPTDAEVAKGAEYAADAEYAPDNSTASVTVYRNGSSTTLNFGTSEPQYESVVVIYDLRPLFVIWLALMAGLLFCDAWRMVYFARHHNSLDKSVLAPIRDITELAATLSANNLSNRINIAGTKNELKDLASVINTMLDRIERSYNSQKQFVSDASHELRTPIAVIQGYVNMLKRWGKDDKTVLDESLSAIAQETDSMKDLVESLLFLARHDKKTLMMEVEEFDPCDVVAELHKEAALVTPEDEFRFAPSEHCTIQADRGMVKQVMRILLDNAVKYTPKGGTITMGVTKTDDGCMLTMQDNGPGIPGEELPKIFDRFYRSDKAREAESGGHGLGLSIARIIVIAHGGKIRVRSKVGEGTAFYVLLPYRHLAKKQAEEASTDKAAVSHRKRGIWRKATKGKKAA